jgi:hypothetical protein
MEYIKIPKSDARKLFDSGLTIYLIPAYLTGGIHNGVMEATPIKKGDQTKHEIIMNQDIPLPFDVVFARYEKANCHGGRVHFYVSKEDSAKSPFSLVYKKVE